MTIAQGNYDINHFLKILIKYKYMYIDFLCLTTGKC
jgi:hypothetical protein